jgi:hypothetical protein
MGGSGGDDDDDDDDDADDARHGARVRVKAARRLLEAARALAERAQELQEEAWAAQEDEAGGNDTTTTSPAAVARLGALASAASASVVAFTARLAASHGPSSSFSAATTTPDVLLALLPACVAVVRLPPPSPPAAAGGGGGEAGASSSTAATTVAERVRTAGLESVVTSAARQAMAAPPPTDDQASLAAVVDARALRALRLVAAALPRPAGGRSAALAAAALATDAERRALLAVRRHFGAPQTLPGGSGGGGAGGGAGGSAGAAPAAAASSSAAAAAAAANAALDQIRLRAVWYAWREMGPPEWVAALHGAQKRLADARRGAQAGSERLTRAAQRAAAALVGGSSSGGGAGGAGEEGGDAPPPEVAPSTAVQLLLKLSAKGVFQRHPAHAVLARDFADAAGRWRLLGGEGGEDDEEEGDEAAAASSSSDDGAAPLQLFAALLALRSDIAASPRPPPQLRTSLDAAWSEALGLVLAAGAAVAVAGAAGPRASAPIERWLSRRGEAWRALASALERDDGGADAALAPALESANSRLESVGVDAVGALLALLRRDGVVAGATATATAGAAATAAAQAAASAEALRGVAWQALLHPRALARLSYAEAAAAEEEQGEDGGGGAGASASAAAAAAEAAATFDLEFDGDVAAYLTAAGVRPEMAAVIANDGAAVAAAAGQQQKGGGGGGGSSEAAGNARAAAERRLLLHWALLLAHLGELAPASPGHRRLALALRDAGDCVSVLLGVCMAAMRLQDSSSSAAAAAGASSSSPGTSSANANNAPGADLGPALDEAGGNPSLGQLWSLRAALRHRGVPNPASPRAWRLLAACCFRGALAQLPASARLWFGALRDKGLALAVEAYASRQESPALLAAEFEAVRRANASSYRKGAVGDKFRVRADPRLREVSAALDVEDGASLELVVRLPACSPLRAPEVMCSNRVGVPDARLRRWMLSVSAFLRSQNQGVLEAVALWRRSLEKEFRGVEPCLICYAVLSPANGQVPKLNCRQCDVVFHGACLYKWFKSSGKSNCPHCQNPW